MVEPSHQPNRNPGARRAARSQPITRHPLFPLIVALWFAALLGMGSFVLRTSLLEALIVAAKIDTVVAAAAPPLGTTARLLVALGFGLVGGTIGWTLAARLARRPASTGDKPDSRVFKVKDTGLDAPLSPRENIAAPKAESLAVAPPAEITPAPTLDPSSLLPSIEAIEPVAIAPAAIVPATIMEVLAPEEQKPEEDPIAVFETDTAEAIMIEQPPVAKITAAERIASAELADLSHVELMERLAIALQKRQQLRETEPEAPAEAPSGVVPFPDLADRRTARQSTPDTPVQRAPQQTEKALRDALTQLQRMSSGG